MSPRAQSRRPVVLAVTLAAACVILPACDSAGPGSSEDRSPAGTANVVVVMTDDQDAASLEVMPAIRHLLGRRGVSFTRSYATVPECCPSRATFLTGQYAHNHGVVSSDPPDGGYSALDHSNTLPVWVREAGYRTAHFGKYLNGYGNPADGNDPLEVPPGWDEWHAPVNHTEYRMYGYELNENGRVNAYGERPRDYLTDLLARMASRFIDHAASSERSFFLSVAPPAPHSEAPFEGQTTPARNPRPAPRHLGASEDRPLPAPPSLDDPGLTDKPAIVQRRAAKAAPRIAAGQLEVEHRSRLESLLAADELVRELVGALRRAGVLRETYFLFTSDNGYLLGEHGLIGKSLPYEESARVPLVIRGPGIPAGAKRHTLTANVDLAATITEVAGAEPGLRSDGVSLLDLAHGGSGDRRRAIVIEYLTGEKSYAAVRTASDLMMAEYASGDVELYDMRDDPYQLDNLARDPAHAAMRSRLHRSIEALRDCAGEACR